MAQKTKMTQTPMLKKKEIRHSWYILDATGKTLGRFAAEIAKILRGKHKPSYTPYEDCGDGVIVLNAGKIKVTGNKEASKIYRRYTGYMGGMRETVYRTMLARNPEYIIEHAVAGMMSKSRLGHQQTKRLRVFKDTEHQMEAQNPIVANI